MLKLPEHVTRIHTAYIGVQSHRQTAAVHNAEEAVQAWLNDGDDRPAVVDTFRVVDGWDIADSKTWVAYWTDEETFESSLKRLDLKQMYANLGDERHSIGLWTECFTTPVERLETKYAMLVHKPGLAQLPDTEQPSHKLSAYWGAARDRIPASDQDLFAASQAAQPPAEQPAGLGEHLTGTNYDDMCHIRSGQWWEACDDTERKAYEDTLEPTLMAGMRYLWENSDKNGTIGLRFLRNLDGDGAPMKETCGAGFFRNLADLEQWAKRHPSHLAIFNGAHRHAKAFGPERRFMTWHEVSVLKAGEARFEYVNCQPRTGVIKWVGLEREPLPV